MAEKKAYTGIAMDGRDNWAVIFFEALREEYWKKGKKDIFKLVDKKVSKKALSLSQESQAELFS